MLTTKTITVDGEEITIGHYSCLQTETMMDDPELSGTPEEQAKESRARLNRNIGWALTNGNGPLSLADVKAKISMNGLYELHRAAMEFSGLQSQGEEKATGESTGDTSVAASS
jgi:hypothetical protein